MKHTFLLFGILLSVNLSFAQQDSNFSHYMFNQQIVNPAYAELFNFHLVAKQNRPQPPLGSWRPGTPA